MAAQKPKGTESLPDKPTDKIETAQVEVEDVKETAQESEPEVTEEDLTTLEEAKKIPYNRFKEVNDQKKALQTQISELKGQYDRQLQRAVEDVELRLAAKFKNDQERVEEETGDPWETSEKKLSREISTLKTELSDLRGRTAEESLKSSLNRLQEKYPEADTNAVLGWKKSLPHSDLEELMEKSHNTNIERVERAVKNLIESKKKKAKESISPLRESGIRLKNDTTPKTMKEARKAMFKHILGS